MKSNGWIVTNKGNHLYVYMYGKKEIRDRRHSLCATVYWSHWIVFPFSFHPQNGRSNAIVYAWYGMVNGGISFDCDAVDW